MNNNTGVWQKAAMPVFLMIVFVIGIIGVVNLSKSLKNPPKLTISGSKEIVTTADKVMISGTTDPKADLNVNEQKVAVDKNGAFTYTTATLKEGSQTFKIVASKQFATSNEKVKVTKSAVAKVDTTLVTTAAPSTATNQSTNPKVNASPAATNAPSVATGGTGEKTTATAVSGTPTSGPAESVFGAFGLTLLGFSLYAYKKSLKIANQTTYKSFTSS